MKKSFNAIIVCSYSYSLCMKYTFDGDLSGWAAPAFCGRQSPKGTVRHLQQRRQDVFPHNKLNNCRLSIL